MSEKELEQIPQSGDVIYVHRKWGVYKHFGVYIGNVGKLRNQVIHFTGSPEHETRASEAKIRQDELAVFLKGGKLHIQDDIGLPDPLSRKEIINRAKSQLNKGYYKLVDNNCEHFANWCRYGAAISRQGDFWKKAGKILVDVGKGSLKIAAAIVLLTSMSKNSDRT